jgi:AcrR family transcriptional regulator
MATALAIANGQGLEALTLRRLADTLNVAPMTMYRYFENKEDLLNAMFDYVSSLPDLESCRNRSWRKTILNAFAEIKNGLVSHTGIMPLLSQRYGSGEMTDASAEFLLEALSKSGKSEREIARTFYALVSYSLGFAVMESAMNHQAEEAGFKDINKWLAKVDHKVSATLYPERAKLVPHMKDSIGEKQFQFGIEAILNNLDG